METNERKRAHVAELLQRALELGLEGAEWMSEHGIAWCCDAYNGIGPEFMGERLRGKVTGRLSIFEPAALVHDGRNEVSDGTRESFLAANDEFLRNCLALADRAYCMIDPRRYRARAVAETLYLFVSADGFGWKAWLQAHERHLAKTKEANHA